MDSEQLQNSPRSEQLFLQSGSDNENEGVAKGGHQELAAQPASSSGNNREARADDDPAEGQVDDGEAQNELEQTYTPPPCPDHHKVQVFPTDYHRDTKFYTWYMVGHEIEDNRGDAEKSGPDWFLDIQGRSVEDTVSVLVTALLSAKGSDQQLMTQPWASGRPSPSSQTRHSSCLLHFGNFISFLP
jgi:hypothetical protein